MPHTSSSSSTNPHLRAASPASPPFGSPTNVVLSYSPTTWRLARTMTSSQDFLGKPQHSIQGRLQLLRWPNACRSWWVRRWFQVVRGRRSRPVHRFTYPPRGSGEASGIYTTSSHLYTLLPPHLPAPRYPSGGSPSCSHSILPPCKNSTISTGLHPSSTANSATYYMGRSIKSVRQPFKATI